MTEIKDEILHQVWLKAACELFRQNFFDFPDVVATYGFPASNSSDGFRGACHFPEGKEIFPEGKEIGERRPVIIIHPAEWENPTEVLTILLHECIHASFPKGEGHGERFTAKALEVGLALKDNAWDSRTPVLEGKLKEALKLLPPMPKDPLGRGKINRQKGRMLLFMCSCKFKIRCGKKELLAKCERCHTAFELVQ